MARDVDILTFWQDVLAPYLPLLRSDSWNAWKVALKALFALPMDDTELVLYRACTGRNNPPATPAREAWFSVGRRGGKTYTMAILLAFLATVVAATLLRRLAPGERGVLMMLARDRRQARVIRRYVGALFNEIPMLRQMVVNETKEAIQLSNGIDIEIHTASYRSVRGYTIVGAILDEVAFWPTDDSAEPDTEVINALRPAMSTTGGLLMAISSPYARRGSLYRAYRRHHGRGGDVLVWCSDTATMNPTIDGCVIERAFEEDEVAAWSEYGRDGEVRFRSDVETYVSLEAVEACVVPGRRELPSVGGVRYAAFVDPSGGGADAFALAIGHTEAAGGQPVAVVDCVRERRSPLSPEQVVEEYAKVLKTYGVRRVTGDRYAGEWPQEAFGRHGIAYEASAKPKSELYKDCLAIINAGRIELPDSDRLKAQLVALERRTARGGRDSIDHPPGGHDDLANVVAGLAVGLAIQRSKQRTAVWGRRKPREMPEVEMSILEIRRRRIAWAREAISHGPRIHATN